MFDYLIVGAGFAGSVLAERLASPVERKVLLVDRRHAFAGNAYDHYDEAGVLDPSLWAAHLPHQLRARCSTTSRASRSGGRTSTACWLAWTGSCCPCPINLDTVNGLYGLDLDCARSSTPSCKGGRAEASSCPQLRGCGRQPVGRDLYEKFFRNYTRKQWGLDPRELDAP